MIIVSVKNAISVIKASGLKFQIDELSQERACIKVLSITGNVFMRSNYAFIGYIQRLLY